MKPQKSDLEKIIELAGQRRVASQAGVKRYGSPVGSIITDGVATPGETKRPITIVRLRSLQRQYKAALAVGNLGLARSLHAQLQAGVDEYSVGKSAVAVLDALKVGDENEAE